MRILVTRQQPQAQQLVDKINQLPLTTISAIACPLLEIVQNIDHDQLNAARKREHDLAIFTSTAAVKSVATLKNFPAFLPSACAAIGNATAAALKKHGITQIITPTHGIFSSENLLATLSKFNYQHHSVLIFKGKEGRNILAKELQAAKVEVTCITCYERHLPPNAAKNLNDVTQQQTIDLILASCETVLYNLTAINDVNLQTWAKSKALLVASQRIKATALALGWKKVYLATGASDSNMLTACIKLQEKLWQTDKGNKRGTTQPSEI